MLVEKLAAIVYAPNGGGTGYTFPCTCTAIAAPIDFRSGIVETLDGNGGYDMNNGRAEPVGIRQFDVKLIHVYQAGETFNTVWRDFMRAAGHGYPVQLQFTAMDTSTRVNNGARIRKIDKAMATDFFNRVEIPVSIETVDPWTADAAAPGVRTLDVPGFLLDQGRSLDPQPDSFALTGTAITHAITNNSDHADDAPIWTFIGPITGPITITNQSMPKLANGNWPFITYNANIATGESVQLNTGTWTVTSSNGAVNAYANFPVFQAGQDTWIPIIPGNNSIVIAYGAAGSGASLSIDWRGKYA